MRQKTCCAIARACMALIVFLCINLAANAQKTVSGIVKSSKGNAPVGFATITVKGTNDAAVSDAEGKFVIKLPAGRTTIIVSSVGFVTAEVDASSGNVDVVLTETTSSLDEIVVTGYTAQRKKDITGAVSVVNVKELVANPGSNVEALLQGKAAGVTVGTSGVPGAGVSVRIRGFTTFNQNEPLYIVDGARVGSITDLNPNDIESLQVLKDGSSAAVYGAAAANGVIIITTKKGKGKVKVSYDGYYGTQSLTKKYSLLNTDEYGQYLLKLQQGIPANVGRTKFNLGQYNGGLDSTDTPITPAYILAGTASGVQEGDPRADPSLYKLDIYNVDDINSTYLIVAANKKGTDWQDAIFDPAPMQNHNVSVSGGSETGNYLLGLNYYDQDGIINYTGYKRYSIRANSNYVIKNKVRVGENLQVSLVDNHGFTNQDEGNAISMAYRMQPIVPVYDIGGNFAGTRGSNLGNASNPYANLYRGKDNKDKKVGIMGSVYAEVDFLKYFTIKSVFGMDYGNWWNNYFNTPSYENAEGRGGTGEYGEGRGYDYQLTWYNTLNFHKQFGDKHDVKALIGTEIVQYQGRRVFARNTNYFVFDRNFYQVSSGQGTTPYGESGEYRARKYSPIIGKLDYTYNERYLLSGSFRRDGSSNAFGPNSKYGNFASGSLGWRISQESFMKNISWINDLKLRVGYGILGNDNTTDFGFVTSYVFDAYSAGYPIDGSNSGFQPGIKHNAIGNPDIKWEQSATTNVGFDATLFKNSLSIVLDLYKRKTTDLLYNRRLDPTLAGYVNLQPTNIGDMTNRGIDLALTYRGGQRDFKFDVGAYFSLYRNEVGSIADPYFEGSRSRIDPFNRSVTGRPISSFYGYIIDGFFQTQEDLDKVQQSNEGIGKWRYKDITGPNGKPDGVITPDDRTFMGNPHPNFTLGLNFSASYKNFDFSAFLYWKDGGQIVNYVRYWTDFNTFQGNRDKRVLYDSWTPEHRDAKLPVLDGSDGASGQVPVSYYVEPGGYLRLRNFSIGYSIPSNTLRRLSIDRLRIYVQAQNLFTITEYTGLDPEITTQVNGRWNYRDAVQMPTA
jgi:TonB-linked SusC/RagA family outer membrane protein